MYLILAINSWFSSATFWNALPNIIPPNVIAPRKGASFKNVSIKQDVVVIGEVRTNR